MLLGRYLLVLVHVEASEHLDGQVLVDLGLHLVQVAVSVHFRHVPATATTQDVLSLHTHGRLAGRRRVMTCKMVVGDGKREISSK